MATILSSAPSQLDRGPRLDRTVFSLTLDSAPGREQEYEERFRGHAQPDEISGEEIW